MAASPEERTDGGVEVNERERDIKSFHLCLLILFGGFVLAPLIIITIGSWWYP